MTDYKESIYAKLSRVQLHLKAPKSQFNKFGNYAYRSAEDILEALKPVLAEVGLALVISDEVTLMGDRFYIRATACVNDFDGGKISATAYAREADERKGMDSSQVTGSASSYARKYALNGLFAIDDTKEADATNTHDKSNPASTPKPAPKPAKADINKADVKITNAQVQRMFAIAKQKGIDNDTLKELVVKQGVSSSKDLNKKQYDAVIEQIEKR